MEKVKSKAETERKAQGSLFELGNEQDDKLADSRGRDFQFLKMENNNGPNIFGFLSPRYFTTVEHWCDIEGKREKAVCAVHAGNDKEKIMNGRDAENCVWCERVAHLFQEAKEDPEDAINKKKKAIAKDLIPAVNFVFLAIKGDAEVRRQGSSKVVTPFFESIDNPGMLQLTDAGFRMFKEQFEKENLKGSDLVGMPVNFRRGKKTEKSTYNQVLEVEFYPKAKFKAPAVDPDKEFVGLVEYDKKKSEELFAKWDAEFSTLLDEVKGTKAGRKR